MPSDSSAPPCSVVIGSDNLSLHADFPSTTPKHNTTTHKNMINQFIPLTITQDGKYSIARNEASTITAPYQGGNSMPFFWIERKGEVFGAIRNLNLAGSSQEKMFDLLKEKAIDAIV